MESDFSCIKIALRFLCDVPPYSFSTYTSTNYFV